MALRSAVRTLRSKYEEYMTAQGEEISEDDKRKVILMSVLLGM